MFFSRKDPLPLQDWYVSLRVPTVGFCRNYYTYLHSTGVTGNFSCKGQNIVFLPRTGVLKPVEKPIMKKSRRRQSAYPDLNSRGAPRAHQGHDRMSALLQYWLHNHWCCCIFHKPLLVELCSFSGKILG